MRKKCSIILLLLFYSGISMCTAQQIAIKTNLMYGIYFRMPNAGIELGVSPRSSLELNGGYNWFTPKKSGTHKKLVHWLGVSEYRYWTCERFTRHFGSISYGYHFFLGNNRSFFPVSAPVIGWLQNIKEAIVVHGI
ncbi:DUF3575 domain-containing protein [Bacteroides salyersiae]|uniref:DUF3575 domain-containing protein n=2 Tax=Bacteroides salyersiae TaxID=291644 RepID=A0A7J4XIH5_9BACE|nr:DUF3575 domain-containing protein [Bacteroides salyersiae]KAA3691878.1 DUF3575 domain-containing protein [Bacteroides salyersiae]KAA3694502.1 DUF3575 domain-containing protein [Bacteroides salyersiae]KAA3695979.1 DUF3575 domain-containing protein [Bacteroides salyersiae]KAA3703419.1 DUF3575 domain-containing protein [Bacteroides salyersiae]KAA3710379.1 DUF3575 domain-containing protein [Bacteroides salyersiae]